MSSRRNKGGGGGHGDGGEERWLLPYADMITLLLGLFIVLFAMSTIDAKQFDNVKRSLSQTFNGAILDEPGDVMPGSNGVLDPTNPSQAETDSAVSIDEATRTASKQFDRQAQQVQKVVDQLNLGNDVRVVRNERGIQINIAGDALFESGSWEIKPAFRDKLVAIERQLQQFNRGIEITGHTDGVPYKGDGGNRRLGYMRAEAVYELFVERGYPSDKIRTGTMGEDDPRTKPQNDHESNKLNRRIEIMVLEPGANDTVPNLTPKELEIAEHGGTAPKPSPSEREIEEQLEAEYDTALVDQLAETSKASH